VLKQSSPLGCFRTMRPCRSAAELRAARPFPPSLVASPELNPPSQAQQNRQAQRWPAQPSKTAERSKTAQRSDGLAKRSKVAERSDGESAHCT
jgi:hypothetical protein